MQLEYRCNNLSGRMSIPYKMLLSSAVAASGAFWWDFIIQEPITQNKFWKSMTDTAETV